LFEDPRKEDREMRQAQKRTGKDGTRRRVQLHPIICIVCGRTFTPRKVNAKTCSNKCRGLHRQQA
jgi:hypothetical protein